MTGTDPRPIAVVDIDGVVADVRHRLHHLDARPKDWNGFFRAAVGDPPHPQGIELVTRLADDYDVVFLTGRPERTRSDTERWLAGEGLGGHRLEMRSDRDRRPAAVLKVERLRALAEGTSVAVVIDDDAAVVAAVRAAGFPVVHADWEARAPEEQAVLTEGQEVEGRT